LFSDTQPRVSKYGLDRTAALLKKDKQESQTEEPSSKRSKIFSYKDGEQDSEATPNFRSTIEADVKRYHI
jgi:hypothetical protein